MELVTKEQEKEVKIFLKKLKSVSEKEMETMDKEGVFTGSYAIHPLTGERVPVYAGNFVVADYGSGMVMAVPAHDQRDFDFAVKYDLPMKVVIEPKDSEVYERNGQLESAYTGEGNLINSGEFDGLRNKEAKEKILYELEKKKLGKKQVQFKLRDWLISRQRYWGTPIPVVYCEHCGIVPLEEKNLPIKLPKEVKFGKGNPLLTNEEWIKTKCPKCKGEARRETDTMDTFVNSSWYFLRYTDPKNKDKIFDVKKANYWAPVDQYIGGPEHITMHLIYMRFYTKFLRDLGLLEFDEPALRYFTQGLVKGSDGEKMSKSKGNVIEPLETIKKVGADSLRFYLVSNSSPDRDFDWNEKEVLGSLKFLSKVYSYFSESRFGKSDAKIESKFNLMVKKVTGYVEGFRHNLAVIEIRNFFNYISEKKIDKKTALDFLKVLHIYSPFITEELWEKLGNKKSISFSKWPEADESKINENLEREEKAVEKLAEDINSVKAIFTKDKKKVDRVYVYVIPPEKNLILENISLIEKKTKLKIVLYSVNDKDKYDPQEKAKRAKPGKPAIYLE
jgi:leucyl-tRNA synthetase